VENFSKEKEMGAIPKRFSFSSRLSKASKEPFCIMKRSIYKGTFIRFKKASVANSAMADNSLLSFCKISCERKPLIRNSSKRTLRVGIDSNWASMYRESQVNVAALFFAEKSCNVSASLKGYIFIKPI